MGQAAEFNESDRIPAMLLERSFCFSQFSHVAVSAFVDKSQVKGCFYQLLSHQLL